MAPQGVNCNGNKLSCINLREEFDISSDLHKQEMSLKGDLSNGEFLHLNHDELLKSKISKGTLACEFCDFKCNSSEDLQIHISSCLIVLVEDLKSYSVKPNLDKEHKIHVCAECEDVFVFTITKTNKIQLQIYTDDGGNACEECSNRLIKVGDIRQSFENNIPNKIYTCLYCDREFSCSKDHDVHLAQEHNVGQDILYVDSEEDNTALGENDDSGYFENLIVKQEKQFIVKAEKQVIYKQEKQMIVKQEKQKIVKQDNQMIVCKKYKPLHHKNRKNIQKETDDVNITKEYKITKSDAKYRPYACSKCTFRAVEEKTLDKHFKTHFIEKRFICHQCSYKGMTTISLQNHLKTHSDERPYECSYCHYRTNAVGNLRRHERQHTGEKPFSCTKCDYKATQKIALQGHMKSRHGQW